MLRTPLESEKPHKCELPETWDDDKMRWLPIGSYFECDVCGKDYVYKKEWGDVDWYRVHWFNRRKIRERVGIDEHCQDCGYRSYRQYLKDLNAQKLSGRSVMIGYRCREHEKYLKENFDPGEPVSLLGIPDDKKSRDEKWAL